MTRILYVEDNEDNIYMLKSRLERRDFSVAIAMDGEQAVEMAVAEEPDLIIMDLSLPNVDGWEATRRLKANDKTKHIPVVALSAHAMVVDRETALDAGCDDYDTKPVEFQRLLDKIQALLDRTREG
jgi:CheY-like chemotaxis protein